MKKSRLHAALGGEVARSALVSTGDEPGQYKVVGHYAEAEQMDDGSWDVWLTDTRSPAATLGNRRVSNLLARVSELVAAEHVRRYDGEASFTLRRPEDVVAIARVLGIRRSPKRSAEARQAAADRLRELHVSRAARYGSRFVKKPP